MFRNTNDLQDYAIHATDGMVGHVRDFYFDDQAWVIRYLVVDTGNWLIGRKVLVSPMLFAVPAWTSRELSVTRTREQIKNSPDIDTERPVSRQQEAEYLHYYDYPYYWVGAGLAPASVGPATALATDYTPARQEPDANDNPHLRSCLAVTGHHILAVDGEIGHVSGFLVDDQTWAIRYLVVDTSNWWLGRKVLIAPLWIDTVSWDDRTVSVSLTRQAIQSAPAYDPLLQPDRAQELSLYQHYGRADYWTPAGEQDKASIRA